MRTTLGWVYTLACGILWRPKRPPMRKTPPRVAFRRPWPGTAKGQDLWLIGLIIALKGIGYARGHNSTSTDSALRLVTERVSLDYVGIIIFLIAGAAMFCSYCHHGRALYGYAILCGFTLGWASVYAVCPLLLDGPTYAWQGFLTWVIIFVILVRAAARKEPV